MGVHQPGGGGTGLQAWGEALTSEFHGSGSPVGVVTPAHEGDLYVDDTTPAVWQATGTTNTSWTQVGAGGATPGAAIVRKFPFAFNTPNLLTGATVYTPTIGDILLNLWLEITTAWDGTTPKFDLGTFLLRNSGWYSDIGDPAGGVPLNTADNTGLSDQNLLQGEVTGPISDNAFMYNIDGNENAAMSVSGAKIVPAGVGIQAAGTRFFPAKFVTADPIKVCVSQDGTNTGADPGATQGAAVLYLITATPA